MGRVGWIHFQNPHMKTRPPTLSPSPAFTLIELITVIAVITILMSLLYPVLMMARETARRSKASMATKQIVTSCKNYANDYGKYPPIPAALVDGSDSGRGESSYYSYGDTQTGKCKVDNSQLFDVLRGIARGPNAADELNKRKQSYFEDNKATDANNPREGFADGKDFASELQGQLFDPWGKQYCIVLDADGDNMLKLDGFFQDATDPIRSSAAVFSMAKNNEIGGKGYQGRLRKERSKEAPEDIISWE